MTTGPGSTSRGRWNGSRRRSVFTSRLVNSAEDGSQPNAAEDMRAAILSGDEPPGTVIPIDAVARFFGVSQIPVREALKVLQGEGLVEHTPHVGYSVAKLAFDEFRELYEVRRALEVSALRLAVPAADESDRAEAHDAHAQMATATEAGDGRAYGVATRRFHLALIRPSGMQRLIHMYESAWNMTEAAQPMSHVQPGGRALLHTDHDSMLAAFEAGDADALVHEAECHYEHLTTAIAAFRDDPALFRPPATRGV